MNAPGSSRARSPYTSQVDMWWKRASPPAGRPPAAAWFAAGLAPELHLQAEPVAEVAVFGDGERAAVRPAATATG